MCGEHIWPKMPPPKVPAAFSLNVQPRTDALEPTSNASAPP